VHGNSHGESRTSGKVFINNFAKKYHTSRGWKNGTVKYVKAL